MIPKEIQTIFDFIDFLDINKKEYIELYLPICAELEKLDDERRSLRPNENYKQKLQYDTVQKQIEGTFPLVYENVYLPATAKLKELGIWSGDKSYISIKNFIATATTVYKNTFQLEDVNQVQSYTRKYISFRKETNSNFLSLGIILPDLHEVLKVLFDFFKDNDDNDFESFETKSIEHNSIEEALQQYVSDPKKNIRFTLPSSILNQDIATSSREVGSSSVLEELFQLKSEVRELLNSSKSQNSRTSYEEAIYRVCKLKSIIEDNGGFKVFKHSNNQNEAMLQQLFQFVKEGSAWDINAEVNNGRGPVDFTVSEGSQDKTVIEFKLAKSSSLKRNLQHQVEVYKKANNTEKVVIAILYFSQEEHQQVLKILKELNLYDLENVILIDGQQKVSASNVKE